MEFLIPLLGEIPKQKLYIVANKNELYARSQSDNSIPGTGQKCFLEPNQLSLFQELVSSFAFYVEANQLILFYIVF